MSEFPSISTDGSLLIAWQLKDRNVLLVGGGNVAADRIRSLLAGFHSPSQTPRITVICPKSGLNDEVTYRLFDTEQQKLYGIRYIDRIFEDSDLSAEQHNFDLVLTATDDANLSAHIHSICKQQNIVVNVADVPPLCDFYFGSVIKRGPLQIMVSTNGKGPRIANRIRRRIEATLPENIGDSIDNMGKLRAALRKKVPSPEEGKKRMEFMIKVTDKWSLEQLAKLDQDMIDGVLSGWEDDTAYGYSDVTGRRSWWFAECPFIGTNPHKAIMVSGAAGMALGIASSLLAVWFRSKR